MGLHVTRMVLWAALFGIAIAIVIVPLVPLIVDSVTGSGLHVNGKGMFGVDVDDYFDITSTFVAFAVMLFVANRLLEILKTLRFGSPFVKENADRFRAVGYALMIGEGAKFVFGFLSLFFDADISINTSFIAWISIVAVFVLAEVFSEGARMKEEQDLTV